MHGTLTEHHVFILITQLGLIILLARCLGEVAKRIGQPVMVGELFAGILLGPAILGKFLPQFYHHVFPAEGPNTYLLQGISWLCVMFLLLITGLEIDVGTSLRHGRQNFLTAIFGFLLPFAGVFGLLPFFPDHFFPEGVNPLHFQLLFATALAVVAMPVISKILFDLKILRSNVGLNIITSGVLSDVLGWALISVIIAIIGGQSVTLLGFAKPIIVIVLLTVFALTAGRWLIDRMFELFDIHGDETTSLISLLFAGALINGSIAHMLGIHAIFGAFIAGIMVGESKYITPYTRKSTEDFIFGVFAPIFFVLIGMQIDLTKGLDIAIVVILLIVTSLLKVGGGFLGAILAGVGRKNALAVGCGLNTQGTMGIIIGLIGLELGIFNEEVFVIIVFICVSTSILVGPMVKWAITRVRRPLAQYFDRNHVFLDVEGKTKDEVIKQMCFLMGEKGIIDDIKAVSETIFSRERTLSTAIGDGIALPHARMKGLESPVLCFFRLKHAVDFDSPDNEPVRLLFLELTDIDDHGMQLNLISQVAQLISSPKNREKLLTCQKAEDVHHIMSFDEKV